jgi:hypothetical protein
MIERPSSAGTRVGLALVLAGTTVIGVAYGSVIVTAVAPAWTPWLLAFGCAATAIGLFVIGSATRGRVTLPVGLMLAALFALIAASFTLALAMAPNEGPGGALFLGLPLRLAIVFYGVGLVPLFALPIAYGLTFREHDGA